ncbi:AMP-binding protein [Paucilactobacillus wasatchensis]|uniref:Long-chain-fatty-acid--CoA ligase n=1 Tax=Paucilactobacillus wasatchensis TaxID=1335616 RepID=A0A0D1A823_9LACO|nr:AMP-binding protein [Paucilactobacillus wasatchensis]KIS02916.1 Long-chain-fatty-acid--CoA ligase [Paucilactobacillus wasatchensis]
MTELTNKLTKQLINDQDRNLIKDETLGQWFTGRQLKKDVASLRQYFLNARVEKGDLVLVCLDNSAVYPVLMQALWEIGAVAHPVAATTPVAQLQAEFTEHDYALLIAKSQLADQIVNDAVLQRNDVILETTMQLPIFVNTLITDPRSFHSADEPDEDDLALILNTSGTTGKPKRVGLTHRLLINAAKHNIESHQMNHDDTAMIVMPMFHINAQVMSCLSTRLSGGRLLITGKFSASHFWQQVSDNDVTWVSVVPTIVSILLINDKANNAYAQLSDKIHLRFVRCSSFSLPESKFIAFQDRYNTQILEGYGMTETTSQCTLNPFGAQKIGSAGKPVGTELAILVDGQLQTSDTEIGEIVVRGDHVIADYMDSQPESFSNGWFLTGDLGYLDADGYLFVKGRSKDMINRGGEKVAPAEVQSVLSQLDFIAEVAVIGMPDDLYGEAVTAVVKPKDSLTDHEKLTQELQAFAQKNLAKFEQPTRVEFVDDFPRNPTGKVLRSKLKEELLQVPVGK